MGPAVVAVAILALVLLVAWGKVHPFLAFILVSAGAALALGKIEPVAIGVKGNEIVA